MDNADKTARDAQAAQAKADEAAAKLNLDGTPKSKEQLAAEKLQQDADDKAAKAAEAGAAPVETVQSMAEAKTLAVPEDADVAADSGHWRAQKFGNDPANPQPATADHSDPDQMTVQLTRKTPDLPGKLQTTWVHPEMVGDYMRAGWSRAEA